MAGRSTAHSGSRLSKRLFHVATLATLISDLAAETSGVQSVGFSCSVGTGVSAVNSRMMAQQDRHFFIRSPQASRTLSRREAWPFGYRGNQAHNVGMRESDFRLLIVVMVFLGLFIVWAWPVSAVWGTDPMPVQSAK
jgi:hypothetical protein